LDEGGIMGTGPSDDVVLAREREVPNITERAIHLLNVNDTFEIQIQLLFRFKLQPHSAQGPKNRTSKCLEGNSILIQG
jgi:hypothetical protein